ncbi:MAG: phytoene desaturase [Pseudomonadota bacterium]
MTRHQSFDNTGRPSALVIGAGLGGLAAAMRLGAKGYAVTVLDRLDRPGGRASSITRGGHRFDLGPTIITVPQVYEKLWADCGRDFHSDVDLRALDPFYEIRWPDGSVFRARGDTEAMVAEVARLSPADALGYRRYLEDSRKRYVVGFEGLLTKPMQALWETIKVLPTFAWLRADRAVFGQVKRRIKDPRVRMALSYHPLLIGGNPTRVTSMYALVSYLEKEFGVHYAMGGTQALAEAMVRVIEDQGGVLRMETTADEILVKGGHVAGVRLASGEVIPSSLVVSNADVGHTYDHLMRRAFRWRWTPEVLRRRKWSMGLYVWYFGTKGTRGMWPDVGQHTILSGPRYEALLHDVFLKGHLAGDMSLYVHRPSVIDPSVAPRGDDTFYVLSPVPHLGHRTPVDWAKEEEPYRKKMTQVLQSLIPGFDAHLTEQVTFTPEVFRDRYLSFNGSGFSLEPRILQSAWFRPHNVSEEAQGLYLVGAGTHPGAGVPGVVASAEVVDQLIPEATSAPVPAE